MPLDRDARATHPSGTGTGGGDASARTERSRARAERTVLVPTTSGAAESDGASCAKDCGVRSAAARSVTPPTPEVAECKRRSGLTPLNALGLLLTDAPPAAVLVIGALRLDGRTLLSQRTSPVETLVMYTRPVEREALSTHPAGTVALSRRTLMRSGEGAGGVAAVSLPPGSDTRIGLATENVGDKRDVADVLLTTPRGGAVLGMAQRTSPETCL